MRAVQGGCREGGAVAGCCNGAEAVEGGCSGVGVVVGSCGGGMVAGCCSGPEARVVVRDRCGVESVASSCEGGMVAGYCSGEGSGCWTCLIVPRFCTRNASILVSRPSKSHFVHGVTTVHA